MTVTSTEIMKGQTGKQNKKKKTKIQRKKIPYGYFMQQTKENSHEITWTWT